MNDWHQTPKTVTLSIPLAYKVDSKKVDTTIAKNFVKLNIPEMKIFKFIDLFDEIEIDSSSILIEDNKILFYLNKIKEEKWPSLEYKASSKEEIKERRKIAEDELNQKISELRETAMNKKKEFEKFVMERSIKIEDEMRKELSEKKKLERNQAENELYEFINDFEKNKGKDINENFSKLNNAINEDDSDLIKQIKKEEGNAEKFKSISNSNENSIPESSKENDCTRINDLVFNENNKENFQSPKYFDKNEKKQEKSNDNIDRSSTKENYNDKNIFDSKSMQSSNTSNQAAVRPPSNITVNLTEKMIPHFAARESLSKEPPYPKSKKFVPEKNYLGQEIEDRNPIWIKEKADNFFKNKDYRSAINAYNRAIDLDKDFHKCYLNRATSLLLLGEFDLALKDLITLQDTIERLDPKEREAEESFYSRLILKSKLKQFAIYSLTSQFTLALSTIEEVLSQIKPGTIDEKMLNKIYLDKELINNRIKCEEIKLKADACVNRGEYQEAKELYLDILGVNNQNDSNSFRIINPNERILSNLSLIAINTKDYESAITYCTECIKIIKSFKEKISTTNPKKFENFLEIKILLRRAESYVALNEMTKAQADLEVVERFEIRNQEILEKFNFFKEKLKTCLLENYEKQANSLLKAKEFTEALEYYNRSISLIKKKGKIEQVKFYLNRCSCLIALGQFEKSEEECNRLISNLITLQNIAIIKSDFSQIKNVKDLLFNTYIKRAFANTKSNKIEFAIKDYKLALEINPNDANVKKNLAALEKIV